MVSNRFVTIFILCLVQGCLSKPAAESDLTQGRAIGSTLWGWFTYPFSWWSSEPELPPINELLIASTSNYEPLESIEIAKHNVTIWCNGQTCTTQKCGLFGCTNITCNVYDTDIMGECREYNTISIPAETKPTEPIPQAQDNVTEATKAPSSSTVAHVSSTQKDVQTIEEHPLELEAVLSSTVNKNDEMVSMSDDKGDISSPGQKV